MALISRQAVPLHGFGIVLCNATPVGIHEPEGELRSGMALISGQAVPLRGFGIVLENALAVGVYDPEAELRIWVTLSGAAANFGDPVRVLSERPRRAKRQRQHGDGKGRSYSCWPPLHFNLRSGDAIETGRR